MSICSATLHYSPLLTQMLKMSSVFVVVITSATFFWPFFYAFCAEVSLFIIKVSQVIKKKISIRV